MRVLLCCTLAYLAIGLTSGNDCVDVDMNYNTNDRTEETAPNEVLPIGSIEVKSLKGNKPCTLGESFGFDGDKIWTSDKCRAKFTVCAVSQPSTSETGGTQADETADVEVAAPPADDENARLKEMFGKNDKEAVSDIVERLLNEKTDAYKDKCVCTIYGDPHFEGFDGSSIHFHGVCEYTAVRTKVDQKGCGFSINVEQQSPENGADVTYVKRVNIKMFGTEIQLGHNNELIAAGEKRSDFFSVKNMFYVITGGIRYQTFNAYKCGLQVTLKDNHKVEIMLSNKYEGKVEGLCGDCNDNPDNDYLKADGTEPTDATQRNSEVGASWQAAYREGLPTACQAPVVPTERDVCTDTTRPKAEEICEPLRNTVDGPFKECITGSDRPMLHFFSSCLTDACAFVDQGEEANKWACKIMQTMADRCRQKGFPVSGWRQATQCTFLCPANAEYFEFTPKCQPSCSELEPKGDCLKDTSEACICKKGFLLNGDKCVQEAQCGCKGKDRFYDVGYTTLSKKCDKKYTCVLENGESIMDEQNHECGDNAFCTKNEKKESVCKCKKNYKGDGYDCVEDEDQIREEKERKSKDREAVNDGSCLCRPWGDPHYNRFDGDVIHFQGSCTYLISATTTQGGACDYSIIGKNEYRGDETTVTFIREVYLTMNGVKINLLQGMGVFTVRGEPRQVPVELVEGIQIVDAGKLGVEVILTACGVHITYDGDKKMTVRIPKEMGAQVDGLCGNCDGTQTFTLRDGTDVTNEEYRSMMIGNSWRVPNPMGVPEDDTCPQDVPEPTCEGATLDKIRSTEQCGRLTSGPFQACIDILEGLGLSIEDIVASCEMDACLFQDDPARLESSLCTVLEEAATMCIMQAGIGVSWRESNFCAKECPANSVYNPIMSGCQPTCAEPTVPESCDREQREGCECAEGLLLDGGRCIEPTDCGCETENGDYLARGNSLISRDCTTRYTCVGNAELGGSILESAALEAPECGDHATCNVDGDSHSCECDEGYIGDGFQCELEPPTPSPSPDPPSPPPATGNECNCKATGDPKIVQYDNNRMWVYDACKFVLTEDNRNDGCGYSVQMKTVPETSHPHNSFIYEVDVVLDDVTIRLGQNLDVQLKSDATLGLFVPKVIVETLTASPSASVVQDAESVTIFTQCNVVVKFDGKGEVTVRIPRPLTESGSMQGLCGNCDGNDMNDGQDAQGLGVDSYPTKEDGFKAISRMFIVPDDSSLPNLSQECARGAV